MKVFINRKPINAPWGGGNAFVKAFHELAPTFGIDVTSSPHELPDVDVILVIGADPDNTGVGIREALHARVTLPKRPRIIVRVNENDARKGTVGVDDTMIAMISRSDGVVYVSNWIKQYFQNTWINNYRSPPTKQHLESAVIINGVDRKVFFKRLALHLYDCARTRVIAHHWSSHTLKGADYYNHLDQWCDRHEGYRFHYIGRPPNAFTGKHTKVTPPCFGKELGEALGFQQQAREIYVSASRNDPGPNHVIEAIASGLDTYVHKDGGGAVEFAGDDHTFSSFDELKAILERAPNNPNKFVPPTWEECIGKYVEYIQSVVKE